MKEVQAQAARLVPISGQREERRPKPTPGAELKGWGWGVAMDGSHKPPA
jgi:hypothetical protein